jgi:alkylated DNA repair dioxygenase AlkB
MSQINIFGEADDSQLIQIKTGVNKIKDGLIIFYPDYFSGEESRVLFDRLISDTDWKQESMKLYGKTVPFPRLTAWYGERDKAYTFSGITLQPNQWTKDLLTIKQRIEAVANITFNSALLNLYRDGNDSISWHTDAEKELGQNPVIGSVNFGATRTFQLRHKLTKEQISIPLKNGSLLIMGGALQHFWQHQVPKTTKQVDQRINLTFRELI